MAAERSEPLTEKDKQLVKLLIQHPNLTNARIAKLIGVSRQAVSERRKRLEREGIIQKYVFWDVPSKIELTKEFEIVLNEVSEGDIDELIEYLLHNWNVVFIWVVPAKKVVSGIILTSKGKVFRNILIDEFPFIRDVRITAIEFRKFLGQRVLIKKKGERELRKLAYEEASRLSKRKSVNAILFSIEPQGDVLNLLVLRNPRFHSYSDITSTYKVQDGTYIHIRYGTLELLKKRVHNARDRRWIRRLYVAFIRNERDERRIRYLLRLARHL